MEVGETLKFPTTAEEVRALFARIGIDGIRYQEYFITSYDSDVLGLYDYLGEYESLDELNYLAHLLAEMEPGDLEKLEAIMDAGEYTGSVKDLINLTQNLDCYEFYSDIHDHEALGRMYILDFEAMKVPEHLIDYIDYEAYGRDVRINEGGHFAPGGYVSDNQGKFIEHYTGLDDIPEDVTLDGKVVTFIGYKNQGAFETGLSGTFVEEDNGDTVDSALFESTKAIEDRFGVDLVFLDATNTLSLSIKGQLMAGETEYDVLVGYGFFDISLAAEGYVLNLNDLSKWEADDIINHEKSYWFTQYIDGITYRDNMCWLVGDISTLTLGCMYVTFVGAVRKSVS